MGLHGAAMPRQTELEGFGHVRCRFKSTTMSTLLRILSHCVDNSLFIEAHKSDNNSDPVSVAVDQSQIDGLYGDSFESLAHSRPQGNRTVNESSETDGVQDEMVVEGSALAENLGPVALREGDSGAVCAREFETQNILVELNKSARTRTSKEISSTGSVPLDRTEHTIVEGDESGPQTFDKENESDRGDSHLKNFRVLHQEGTETWLASRNKEVDMNRVNTNYMSSENPIGIGVGNMSFCVRGTWKVEQHEKSVDSKNADIGKFRDDKYSTRVAHPDVYDLESCIDEHDENNGSGTGLATKSSNAVMMSSSAEVNDSIDLTDAREIEEGEISDDKGLPIASPNSIREDSFTSDKKWTRNIDISIDLGRKDGSLSHGSQVGFGDLPSPLCSSFPWQGSCPDQPNAELYLKPDTVRSSLVEAGSIRSVKKQQNNENEDKMTEQEASPKNHKLSGAVPMECQPQHHEQQPREKDDKDGKKEKRTLTEERKSKKKSAKKRKRAELNRKLGVKRLKLEPISKPKVVIHCKYYMKGRCQQGDECKFSHDVIPLTKSQPCKYFACNSCLKGDDCPFDHQLSKYPCHNFMSKGTCIRGDSCLFSHKIPAAENALEEPVDKDESLLAAEKAKLQKHPDVKRALDMAIQNLFKGSIPSTPAPLGSSLANKPSNQIAEKKSRPTLRAPPAGITFLSFGKSLSGNTSKTEKQDESLAASLHKKTSSTVMGPPRSHHVSVKSSAGGSANFETPNKLMGSNLSSRTKSLSSDAKVRYNFSPLEARPKINSSSRELARNAPARTLDSGSPDASLILEEFLFGSGV